MFVFQLHNICAIATAAHVIEHAYSWDQPIRIDHYGSGKSILLQLNDRRIELNEKIDTAAIMFYKNDLPIPTQPIPLITEENILKVGTEVGWLGFPAISQKNLCFFREI